MKSSGDVYFMSAVCLYEWVCVCMRVCVYACFYMCL